MTNYISLTEHDKESLELYCNFLKENNLVLADDVLIEFTPNIAESICTSLAFKDLSKLLFCNYRTSEKDLSHKIESLYGIGNEHLNLVSNCFSKSVKGLSNLVIHDASLTLGIYSDDSDEFTYGKANLVNYRKELVAKGIPVRTYEDVLKNGDKMFVLSHRRGQ